MSAEVVSLDDSPKTAPPQPRVPTAEDIRQAIAAHLQGKDATAISLKVLRRGLEAQLGLPEGGLDGRKDEVRTFAQEAVQAMQAAAQAPTAAAQQPADATPNAKASQPSALTPPAPPEGAAGAPPAAGDAAPEEPLAKRRKGLFGAGRPGLFGAGRPGGAGAAVAATVATEAPPAPAPTPAPAPSTEAPAPGGEQAAAAAASVAEGVGGPPAKAAKKKCAPSAYFLWVADHRPAISQELAQGLPAGQKPSFGDVARAVSERWKAAPEAEKAAYEQRSAAAKAEAASSAADAGDSAAPKGAAPKAEGGGRGRGRGRGGGRGKAGGPAKDGGASGGDSLSRAEFLRAGVPMQCFVSAHQDPSAADGAADTSPALTLRLPARLFKTGSAGWFGCGKFSVELAGRKVAVNAQMNLTVSGSKHWEDGEGFAEVSAALGATHEPLAACDGPAEEGEQAAGGAAATPAASSAAAASPAVATEEDAAWKEAFAEAEQPAAGQPSDPPPAEEVPAAHAAGGA